MTLHLSKAQHNRLGSIVDHGTEAMHLVTRTLVGRASSTDSSSSSSTCKAGNNSAVCEKPTTAGSGQTLPIVLSTVIPITFALVLLIYLHRRHVKKQRIEDANDAHKSLDFGMDMGAPSKSRNNKPGVPEMTITDVGEDRASGRPRGMSMDVANPYLLPAGLQGSEASIHSMSRMQDEHDPYRPVTMLRSSLESSRPRMDNASLYSASTNHSANEKANLLKNAQRMSRSNPSGRVDSMSPHTSKSSEELNMRQNHSNNRGMPPGRNANLGSTDQPLVETKDGRPSPRKQSLQQSLPQPPPQPQSPVNVEARSRSASVSRPARKSSGPPNARATMASVASETSNYDNDAAIPPPMVTINEPTEYDDLPPVIRPGRFSIDTPNLSQQFPVEPQAQNVAVMGLRPVPSDLPEDNPEVRANRIRSFYKEYFDDSRPNPAAGHYEDGANHLDGAIYDPETGGFVVTGRPFAEAPGRRAMTPPPRGAPRTMGPHRRQFSTQSAGRPDIRGRQQGSNQPPPMPKKRMPPPKPLQGLPTPSKLGDYDMTLSNPIDFAPPASYRQMRGGSAPDSPNGVSRPYSPAVKAFTPLVSAYDDLAAFPSPHLLRKSGTFSTLDFAPPKMLGTRDNGSDNSSIRSAKSGISHMQMDAVRAGAYRVSRIPKEVVTTRDDLATQLRPRMDISR
ncbi:hypothetical protein LTR08_006793 [Meristemomyces frigidus]|nr:hypothetical protein LTR08_006793 [Meristemomyces frigidus]